MRSGLLLALLLVATTLAAPALADHVYSHRYYIYGRVVDAAGAPARGLTVSVTISNQDLNLGECAGQTPLTQRTTDDNGDYLFCHHVDTRVGGAATYVVSVTGHPNATTPARSLDQDLRKSRADITLDRTLPSASRGNWTNFNRSYALWVTLWKPGDTTLENIAVRGTALAHRDITAVFTYNGGKTLTRTSTTDDYGDARLLVDFGENLTEGSVTITSRDLTQTASLNTALHASTVTIVAPKDPWYTNTTLVVLAAVAGLGVVGLGAWGVMRMRGKAEAPAGRVGRRVK